MSAVMGGDTDTTVLTGAMAMLEGGAAEKEAKEAERTQVRDWFRRIDEARETDKPYREGFARDRNAARGVFPEQEVSVPILGGNVDTLKSFIYAQDPSVDCTPSQMVEPPKQQPPVAPVDPMAQVMGAVQGGDPTALLGQPIAEGVAPALSSGGLEGAGVQLGINIAAAQERYQAELAQFEADLAAYQAREEERRQTRLSRNLFAQTMEIVVSKLWKKTRMKRKARRVIGSTLTVGIGWAKCAWIERSVRDPQVSAQISDLQAMVERITREQAEVDEGYCADNDAAVLRINQQIAALQDKVFVAQDRGFVLDFVPAQNIQVAPGTDIMDCCDAPWISEFIYMTVADALVAFPDIPAKKIKRAQRFQKVQQRVTTDGPVAPVTDKDAEEFNTSEAVTAGQTPSDADYLQIAEIYSLDDGTVYTGIRGMDGWAKSPAPPNVKDPRFYPYFPLSFIEVDGDRYPASYVARSIKLQNEYNGRRSALRIARHRSLPAVFFNEGEIDPENAQKIRLSVSQEFVGISTVTGGDMRQMFAPKPLSAIDPALYDTSPIQRDIETVWGVQEALSGGVEVDKTATEAEIQQGGFMSRTNAMRDQQEDWLSDIARYTGTIAVQYLTLEDVVALAGKDAVWPTLDTPEELETLLDIDIRAGSSGKPNLRSERESWQVVMPQIAENIEKVAMLRNSPQSEVADAYEQLVQKSLDVMGDKTDITSLIPQTEQQPPPGAPPNVPA
jgi:hypothetical protein